MNRWFYLLVLAVPAAVLADALHASPLVTFVLAALGLSRPTFPYSERGARVVMLVSLVLVVVTVAMAIHTSTFE